MKAFGIAGFSGSGKTTLIERIIPALVMEGLRGSVVKHAHHEFDIDRPGKDSYRHREAGATEVLVVGRERWALMHELRRNAEPTLDQMLAMLSGCDIAIVEGFKQAPIPKLEVHRKQAGKPLLYPTDQYVVAIATDEALATTLPQFGIEDTDLIANFMLDHLGFRSQPTTLFA